MPWEGACSRQPGGEGLGNVESAYPQVSLRAAERGAKKETSRFAAVAPLSHRLTGLAVSEHLQEQREGICLLLPSGSAAKAGGSPRAGTGPTGRVGMWEGALGGRPQRIHTLL